MRLSDLPFHFLVKSAGNDAAGLTCEAEEKECDWRRGRGTRCLSEFRTARPKNERLPPGPTAPALSLSFAVLRPEVFNFLVVILISRLKAPHSRDHQVPIKSRQEIKEVAAPKGINLWRHNGFHFYSFFCSTCH